MHEVCVDDFYMGKYEVTQGQYQAITGNNPSQFRNGDNYPVEKVSWNDTQSFIRQLNGKGHGNYRLPTEAEWEFAARSKGKRGKYAGGNDIDAVTWHTSNSGSSTHPVGQKQPNGLGLYDMSGNVWEWCRDWYYSEYYGNSLRNNPEWTSWGSSRVNRGGSWNNDPKNLQGANQDGSMIGFVSFNLGFRLVLPYLRDVCRKARSGCFGPFVRYYFPAIIGR